MNKVVRFLNAIRRSHPDMVELYTQGQCYNFHLILREVFPDAVAWYDPVEGHVYSKIGDCWYDIRGRHFKLDPRASILDHRMSDKPHRWGGRDRRRLR